MSDYASNTPVSKPTIISAEEHKSMGGMSWNNRIGLYFPVTDENPPFALPIDHNQIASELDSKR